MAYIRTHQEEQIKSIKKNGHAQVTWCRHARNHLFRNAELGRCTWGGGGGGVGGGGGDV